MLRLPRRTWKNPYLPIKTRRIGRSLTGESDALPSQPLRRMSSQSGQISERKVPGVTVKPRNRWPHSSLVRGRERKRRTKGRSTRNDRAKRSFAYRRVYGSLLEVGPETCCCGTKLQLFCSDIHRREAAGLPNRPMYPAIDANDAIARQGIKLNGWLASSGGRHGQVLLLRENGQPRS